MQSASKLSAQDRRFRPRQCYPYRLLRLLPEQLLPSYHLYLDNSDGPRRIVYI